MANRESEAALRISGTLMRVFSVIPVVAWILILSTILADPTISGATSITIALVEPGEVILILEALALVLHSRHVSAATQRAGAPIARWPFLVIGTATAVLSACYLVAGGALPFKVRPDPGAFNTIGTLVYMWSLAIAAGAISLTAQRFYVLAAPSGKDMAESAS